MLSAMPPTQKRRHIKRLTFLPFVFSALLALFVACNTFGNRDNNDKRIRDIIQHFQHAGLNIEQINPTIYQAITASEGVALFIDGAKVEVYRYDLNNSKQKRKVRKIRESGTIWILGIEMPAIVNGSFIMLDDNQNPNREEIINAFKSF